MEIKMISVSFLDQAMLLDRADFTDLNELAAHRQHLWRTQKDYVARRSALHQRVWKGLRPPDSLEALSDLPFVDKETLRQSQSSQPPFGDYLSADETEISRVHRTSGTTGTAMNLCLSRRDAEQTAAVGGRAQAASGLGPKHRVVHCLNYRMWMGGLTDHMTLEATGATVVPFGVGDTRLLIRTIQELGITAISCTPSYPAVLEQVIAEHFPELKPSDLGLELGLFGGEAGLDNAGFRERLETVWGFKVRNSNYGVTDVFCNFAGQTADCDDLHFMALDILHPELIDPETTEVLPWQEGNRGELVLTHMQRDCQPLVRFRTGDIIQLTGTGRASCGRTAPRFRVIGRADDMVVVRGINAFPTQIAATLHSFPELNGEYRIVLDGPGPYDVLPIEVEQKSGIETAAGLAQAIEQRLKSDIGITARLTLRRDNFFPRTEGKTRRIIRKDGA